MSPSQVSQLIKFDSFELDVRAGELRKGGLRIRLQEQPFLILQTLLENPGDLVTRDELQKKIWPSDTFVDFDHGLHAAVNRLRTALNDSADRPRYIETVARRGYRFIGKLESSQSSGPPPSPARPAPESLPRFWNSWTAVLVGFGLATCVAAMLVAGDFYGLKTWLFGTAAVRHPFRSLAVLPLENLSG